MPRRARLDAEGAIHHVIVRGIEQRRIFDDDGDRGNFVSRLATVAAETDTTIYAWALLPNHAHALVRSGPLGLSKYMRRLLTGHAVYYNRRHERTGYLFQNRYKSLLCEEEPYFRELIRYIHLNPLRAGLVADLRELDSYPWCGHAFVMKGSEYPWHDVSSVLSRFGEKRQGAATVQGFSGKRNTGGSGRGEQAGVEIGLEPVGLAEKTAAARPDGAIRGWTHPWGRGVCPRRRAGQERAIARCGGGEGDYTQGLREGRCRCRGTAVGQSAGRGGGTAPGVGGPAHRVVRDDAGRDRPPAGRYEGGGL